jgi:hypothetical protein
MNVAFWQRRSTPRANLPDPVDDYRRRKGMGLGQEQRWLRPGPNYTPHLRESVREVQRAGVVVNW